MNQGNEDLVGNVVGVLVIAIVGSVVTGAVEGARVVAEGVAVEGFDVPAVGVLLTNVGEDEVGVCEGMPGHPPPTLLTRITPS